MKLITIFLLTFILFVGALIWRADGLVFGDSVAKLEASNRQQISAVVDAIDLEMQNLANILALSFPELEKNASDYSAGAPYSRFQMLANLNFTGDEKASGEWQLSNPHFQEKTDIRSWAVTYIGLALKTIKPSQFEMGSTQVFSMNDPKRNPYLLFVNRGIRQWYVGLLKTDIFQKLMDRQKGPMNSVFIVNSQGQALGHTTQEYVGKMLSEDPLVSEIMKSSLPSGSGEFKNLKQESVQGVYEKIPMSNLYVVITSPMAPILTQKNDVQTQFIIMGVGLCLVGLALFMIFVKKEERNEAPVFTPTIPAPPAFPAGGMKAPVISVGDTGERMSAYTKLASTLSHELKSPLTSVLGNIQLALGQVSDQKAIDFLKRADKEARIARDVIQKLLVFAGEDKLSKEQGNLDVILNKALKNMEPKFSAKGIKLSKNISSVPPFAMPADVLQRTIENILMNAVEAMERSPQKNLTVRLENAGSQVVLSITDSGEGLDNEGLTKAFDPFYTTRKQSQHVGLGLSTAKGVVKEANGEIRIESIKGQGANVIMTFHPNGSAEAAEVPFKNVPPAPAPAPQFEEKTTVTPVLNVKPNVPTPQVAPLLVNDTIDLLIEGAEPEEIQLEQKRILNSSDRQFPPLPFEEGLDDKTIALDEKTIQIATPSKIESPKDIQSSFSAKIDRPNIDLKKKTSKLDQASIAIRRPGEKA